jgi:hypothetical protein
LGRRRESTKKNEIILKFWWEFTTLSMFSLFLQFISLKLHKSIISITRNAYRIRNARREEIMSKGQRKNRVNFVEIDCGKDL